jgi:cation diffusion facilitator family transporter
VEVDRQKTRAALLSVFSNSTLVALKLVVGVSIGSVSVISEGLHSGVDLIAALIALFAVRTAGKPADREHPFGHGKYENLSGTVEALLIFLAAAWIVWEAYQKLVGAARALEDASWGALLMLLSAALNIFVSRLLFKVGKRTDSVALVADAWHLRTDVWTSAGVMTALGAIWLGGAVWRVDLAWIDPIAAIGVALLITHAAYRLTRHAARDLLDVTLPLEEEHWIREFLAAQVAPTYGFHHLRTRKGGSTRFVEFHLWVDPQMSVEDSHALGDRIVAGIKQQFPQTHVIVHVEPYEGE